MFILLFFITVIAKENAVIMVLCRNSDLNDLFTTLKQFEEVFNKKYEYPYVFLNNDDFSEEFKTKINSIVKYAEYGKLEKEEWEAPEWIDRNKLQTSINSLKKLNIVHGESEAYRNMCRFFSGYFYRNKLMRKYDYYWRVEPGVKFLCDIDYDPFKLLKDNNKYYGFVITILEYMETIPSLWSETLKFVEKNIEKIPPKNLQNFIINQNGDYNGCHFWTNFEIANLNFFRSDIYQRYFDHLEKSGGFYYERWGDAPVHSIAVILFAGHDKVHFFNDIGYEHLPFYHCPDIPSMKNKCRCDPKGSIDYNFYSCIREYISIENTLR